MSEKIENYRKEIAEIDHRILDLANNRLKVAEKIGEIKRKLNLPIINFKAEEDVINRSVKLARNIGLNEIFAEKLVNLLINEAINIQGWELRNRSLFLHNMLKKIHNLEKKGAHVIRLDLEKPNTSFLEKPKNESKPLISRKGIKCSNTIQRLMDLQKFIASDFNQLYGLNLDPNQILIIQGEKLAIFSAIISMVSPGNHATILEPASPIYQSCVNLVNGRVDAVHTNFENSWEFDENAVEEIFTIKPKLFILSIPGNPTGKIFTKKKLQYLMHLAKKSGTYILVNEFSCSYPKNSFNSILQVMDSNFIYISSLFKMYGLFGLDVGITISDVKTITKLQSIAQTYVPSLPKLLEYSTINELKANSHLYNPFAKTIIRKTNSVCKELEEFEIPYIKPDGGLYIFPKVNLEKINRANIANKILDEVNVAVAPGEAFGDYPEHFRLSLGVNENVMQDGIKRIGEAINKWRKK